MLVHLVKQTLDVSDVWLDLLSMVVLELLKILVSRSICWQSGNFESGISLVQAVEVFEGLRKLGGHLLVEILVVLRGLLESGFDELFGAFLLDIVV